MASDLLYWLRCRLGAWLLREHIGALCEHYNEVGLTARSNKDWTRKERVDYIGIGLRRAVRGPWERFNDDQTAG